MGNLSGIQYPGSDEAAVRTARCSIDAQVSAVQTNARDVIDHTSDVPPINQFRAFLPYGASGPHDIRVIGRTGYPSGYRLVNWIEVEESANCLRR